MVIDKRVTSVTFTLGRQDPTKNPIKESIQIRGEVKTGTNLEFIFSLPSITQSLFKQEQDKDRDSSESKEDTLCIPTLQF